MQGFGADYLQLAVERGAGALYLHQTWKRVPKADTTEESNAMDTSSDTVRAKTLYKLGSARSTKNRSPSFYSMAITSYT